MQGFHSRGAGRNVPFVPLFIHSFRKCPQAPGHVLGPSLGTRYSEMSLASACPRPKLSLVQGAGPSTLLSGASPGQDPVMLGHGIPKLQNPLWSQRGAQPQLPPGPLPRCHPCFKAEAYCFPGKERFSPGKWPAVHARPAGRLAWPRFGGH